ncbi:hypothetical protein SAMN04488688_10750 [Paenibacillus sp. cl141a]|nr:hypothetical protein SAMN04488688_10750 [Paenibacillus sp. cl141a]
MILKKFGFWLPLFSLLVCIYNATGEDDKNLLLYFTSPHLMFIENYTSIGRQLDGILVLYIINIVGWLVIGIIIDSIVFAVKRK